jgi:hypothetical protein
MLWILQLIMTWAGSLAILPSIQSLTLTPASVVSGNTVTGKVTLTGPAPTEGFVVPLFASTTSITVPASVTVSAGNRDQTFQITTSPTSVGSTVTISTRRIREAASRTDGTSNTILLAESVQPNVFATLTLLPAPVIRSFTLRPTKVKGGANVIAEIALLPAVTSAQTITFSVDRPDLIQLPASVSVPASGVPTPLTLTTHDVNAKNIVTIKAIVPGQIEAFRKQIHRGVAAVCRVGRRIDQHLPPQRWSSPVTGADRRNRREICPSALACDYDPLGIAVEPRG